MDTKSFFIYPTTASEPATPTAGFLDDAGETEWNILLSYVQTRHLRAGETIFTEGDVDRALYVLAIGQLEQSSSQAPTISVDAPAPLNEVAFLDGGRCATTARAVTEGELLRLSYDAFESLAAREPVLGRRILLDLGAGVARRLRSARD
jgi:CRP-like cAMP-binding protein